MWTPRPAVALPPLQPAVPRAGPQQGASRPGRHRTPDRGAAGPPDKRAYAAPRRPAAAFLANGEDDPAPRRWQGSPSRIPPPRPPSRSGRSPRAVSWHAPSTDSFRTFGSRDRRGAECCPVQLNAGRAARAPSTSQSTSRILCNLRSFRGSSRGPTARGVANRYGSWDQPFHHLEIPDAPACAGCRAVIACPRPRG
jgi:hypothetical protein